MNETIDEMLNKDKDEYYRLKEKSKDEYTTQTFD